jgi:hypothetical protein
VCEDFLGLLGIFLEFLGYPFFSKRLPGLVTSFVDAREFPCGISWNLLEGTRGISELLGGLERVF